MDDQGVVTIPHIMIINRQNASFAHSIESVLKIILLKSMQKSTKLLKLIVDSSGKRLIHEDNSHRLMLGVSFVLTIKFVYIDIVSGWGCYFQKLYSESNSPMFDPIFKNDVDVKMRHISNELPDVCTQEQVIISKDDVRKAARQLKCRKACGYDGIFNEHLKNGGIKLHEELALLYTDMYNHGHIPEGLKKGIIITLHEGGRKSKSDPNNYRAITVTSCIIKLFERILLQQVEASLNTPLNMLQGGFRAGLSCNMSSLMLKECISFTKETHSKLFVCFLDVQKPLTVCGIMVYLLNCTKWV